jgi:TetR/AcrR family transcriptional regulator, cholesterol catabolism regulator
VFTFAAMEDKKRELLAQASAIYMKYGIKSVTMDEMARLLGVSKKTLYQYVADKNELVEQCLIQVHEQDIMQICQIKDSCENAIDEMLQISRFVAGQLKRVPPSVFFDLAKYHPGALRIMTNHKQEFVKGCVKENLERGMKQDMYRSNLNVEVLSRIYIATIDHIILGDLFPEATMSMEAIYREFFRYHIKGIASAKGLKYLTDLIKNDENF